MENRGTSLPRARANETWSPHHECLYCVPSFLSSYSFIRFSFVRICTRIFGLLCPRLILSFTPNMAFTGHSFLLSISSFLASLSLVYSQAPINLQPGCMPVPALPDSFSTKPESWPHRTPLLQTLEGSTNPPRVVRRISRFWNGWENVHFLFALYALKPVCPQWLDY